MANLIETATELGQFKTLLTLVESADLLDLLKSPGPYTVFAPTDEAFAALPSNTIANLMEDIPKLQKILSYHVLNGDVRTDNLEELASAETVEGSVVGVDTSDGIKINDAKVLSADRLTDNGVIHAIDKVLIPSLVSV
ncbi:fasciclin domain-containing protein [Oscillatoria acuminata]|uniref:Secreted/surface protein with fasciclin-like repeats n=1 Tax=Oscillatoria acuminata PCC 6304 TaxID=56110 RepID=K9TC95_9CYAN|nr:fasciclin domain-containing protein [Oscillatoria acuminata]AFY80043.1 secreted/surface protein with fasciclin-like repeats [Oscillatoria acuminata PCC 6304]